MDIGSFVIAWLTGGVLLLRVMYGGRRRRDGTERGRFRIGWRPILYAVATSLLWFIAWGDVMSAINGDRTIIQAWSDFMDRPRTIRNTLDDMGARFMLTTYLLVWVFFAFLHYVTLLIYRYLFRTLYTVRTPSRNINQWVGDDDESPLIVAPISQTGTLFPPPGMIVPYDITISPSSREKGFGSDYSSS